MSRVQGIVLLASAVALIGSSTLVRWQTYQTRPVFQPRSPAFCIWSLLFVLFFAHASLLIADPDEFSADTSTWLSVSALCACALWPLAMRARRFAAAAATLLLSACLASAAAATLPMHSITTTWVIIEAATSLFAGWLHAAAASSLAIAAPSSSVNSRTSLVAIVAIAALWAIPFKRPLVFVPLAWTLVCNPCDTASAIAWVCALVVGAASVLHRRL